MYVSKTDQILGDQVPEEDKSYLALNANRYCNMVGGRYSDALRAELDWYLRQGRERYIERFHDARRVAVLINAV